MSSEAGNGAPGERLVRAAGGIVWRPAGEAIEVLLIHRPHRQDWSFPKGKLEPGESEEEWDPLESTCRHASLSIL